MPMWLNWQSSWFVISRLSVRVRSSAYSLKNEYGWIPEWPKGTDCKSAANCFGGSNPPPSIPFQNKNWKRIIQLNQITRGGAVWKLVGLITRRSQVQILSPLLNAQIAQLVEQRTENPRVTGSIPVLGIFYWKNCCDCGSFFIRKKERSLYSAFQRSFFCYDKF